MVLKRLKAWLFGAESEEQSDGETAETSESASEPDSFRCAVCGTAVESPSSTCPLCGANDIEAGDADDDGASAAPSGERVENEGEDPADRLREMRETLLDAHSEKWEETSDGYRVEQPNGEWRSVANKDAVRAVLRERER